jgi:hypothetical protein
MDIIACSFPDGMDRVIDLLISQQWLKTVINEEKELYNPVKYIYEKQILNKEHTILIDTNIFSFIINSYNPKNIQQKHREAIALIAFCCYAEIQIDVLIPIYEFINYNKNKQKEALEKLELFYKIDNSVPETLIDFALAKRDDYIIDESKDVSKIKNRVIEWYNKYEILIEWKSIYLIVLKITELDSQKTSNEKKFELFMNWQHSEFRYSMIGTIYSMAMFSNLRIKGMMKYKTNTKNSEEKKHQIENMTWDCYFMTFLYRKPGEKTIKNNLIATDDKVIKYLITLLVEINSNGFEHFAKNHLSEKDSKLLNIYHKVTKSDTERKFKNNSFKDENHRNNLIKELEHKLL